MRKIYLPVFVCAFMLTNSTKAQNLFSENFDNVPAIIASGGWTQQNNSLPLGAEIWHNAVGLGIPAYNGNDTSAAEVSFQSTDANGVGTINNWLITPTISLNNGDVVSFFTTSFNNLNFPDRLQLRLNPLNTTNVGTSDTSTGDFSVLLVELNPLLQKDSTLYPQDYWKQFSATISGLAGTTDCRIAFRYFVTDGGGTGVNSSTIAVDAFSVDLPVGINETSNELELNVYPNPFSDRIAIDFAKPLSENGKLYIYNSLGQSVSFFNVEKGQSKASLNLSNLAPGSYSFVLTTTDSSTKRNFIKE